MKFGSREVVFCVTATLCFLKSIWCHARLMEPPSRSSMWRFGYETPKNYDDDGLYCGGMNTHWKQNGGKCGVCGDPWHLPPPRPNEAGGKYANGIIVRTYKPGQVIQAVVDVTANHRGFFEFRICPNSNPKKEVTQDCLDKHLLNIVNISSTRYHVEKHGRSRVHLAVKLPQSFLCKQCVFQWTYTAGNNWGLCKNGSYALGCGAQETFKSCADVAVTNKNIIETKSTTNKPNLMTSTTLKPTFKPFLTQLYPSKPTKKVPNKNNNKNKKYPPTQPVFNPIKTFQDAMDRIKKDPRLRWMLGASKPNS